MGVVSICTFLLPSVILKDPVTAMGVSLDSIIACNVKAVAYWVPSKRPYVITPVINMGAPASICIHEFAVVVGIQQAVSCSPSSIENACPGFEAV